MVALLIHKIMGIAFSFTVHGPEEFDRPIALKLEQKIRAAKFVVAISSFGRSQLMRWSHSDDWIKIRVVRCGLDPSWLRDNGAKPTDEKFFVCVGRLCEQKGQLLLVEAARLVVDNGVPIQITLAGDGDMRSAIEQRINELALEKHIRITGWLSGNEVSSILRQSRAMVLPSFAEGLPVVIMESFAMRRPVVTTYIAGIPELVDDGNNGWLVPAGCVKSLAQALENAWHSKDGFLEQLGEAGYESVNLMHDIDEETRKLHEMFST